MTAPPRRRPTPPVGEVPPSRAVARHLVVDAVLHDGGVIVFRGHDADATAVRCVARRAIMRPPAPGEVWDVRGDAERHASHGPQLQLTAATLARPSGQLFVQAVARNTRDFPEIGVARAQRVWAAHGEAVFDLLATGDPAPFVPHLGPELASTLVSGWRALDGGVKACRWLTTHGFPLGLAAKVVAIYEGVPVPPEHTADAARLGSVVWHLEDDPYRLLAFTSWKTADAIARRLGLATDDVRRLVGAAEAVCARYLARGDTWVDPIDLRTGAASLLALPRAAADRGIALACERGALVAYAGGYQLPGTYVMERFVDRRCGDLRAGRYASAQLSLAPAPTRGAVDVLLDRLARQHGLRLTEEQRAAVWMAAVEPVSLLLGGPGVGKTTVLRAVHAVAGADGRAVLQAALSGRAAQRMAETTGRPALTIAALLRRVEDGEITLRGEPLVVIDEASMCDLATVYRLLARLAPGARLLLVGDPGQLPPIGFGLTFHVLAAGTDVPRTTLTRVIRQTDASGIPAVCAAIRAGVVPLLEPPSWSPTAAGGGVGFIDASPGEVTARVIDVLARLGAGDRPQVVGSVKRGPGGVDEINRRLQALRAVGKVQLNGRFFAGDPVLVTRNDYDLGVMNGDLGVAVANDAGGGLRCRFDAGEKVLPPAALAELGYAVTCHKAQGSQFPAVIVPVTPNRLLDRALLLTAVSRAQARVVLVGDRAAFSAAVAAPPGPSLRHVGLDR